MQPDRTVTVRPSISAVLEDAGANWGAYAPGIPGVGVTAATPEACAELLEEALTLHFEGLAEDDTEAPLPSGANEAAHKV